MATFETRTHAAGTTYRVKWRQDGSWQSATFTEKATARRFKKDVEIFDNRWPEQGWMRTGTAVRPVTQADITAEREAVPALQASAPQPPAGTPFAVYAADYVRDKTGVQPDTRTRYANQVLVLAEQLDVIVSADLASPEDIATIENLTGRHVSRWINARETAGASPKTIRNWHGLLFQVLQAATEEGLRATNPCVTTGRALPRRDGARLGDAKVFLTQKEFQLIADAMWPGLPDPERDNQIVAVGTQADRDLLIAAVGTGARWGELTALRVGDVVLSPAPLIKIERAWKTNGTGEYARGDVAKRYLGAPKTIKGRGLLSWGGAPPGVERSAPPHILLALATHGQPAPDSIRRRVPGDCVRLMAPCAVTWMRSSMW